MSIPFSPAAKEITRTRFTGKDFDTFVTEIENFLSSRFPTGVFNNFVASGQGQMMIERESFGLTSMSWAIDRNVDDAFIDTVRLRRAAFALARARGFKPAGVVAPLVDVEFTLDSPQTFPVRIDEGTQLVGPDNLLFQLTEDVDFAVGEVGPKTGTAREGEAKEEVFTSTGEQTITLELRRVPTGKRITQGSVTVTVDGIPWNKVEFIDFEQTDQFEVDLFSDVPSVQFGDGVAGNIPPEDTEIRVNYFASSGTAGAVQGGTITELLEPLVIGLNDVPVTVNNPNPSTPGSDGDTIAKIKAVVPQFFAAAGRAVTQEDYDALINSFTDPTYGAVAIGRATIVRSLEEDAELTTLLQLLNNQNVTQDVLDRIETHWETVVSANCKANLVSVQALARDNSGVLIAPPVGLLTALRDFLNTVKESTVSIAVSDGSINLFEVDVDIEWAPTSTDVNASVVGQEIKDQVESFLLTRTYGQSIRLSDLFNIVEEVEGVDYSHISILEPSNLVDSNGDLVIEDFQIVTLGTVTIAVI